MVRSIFLSSILALSAVFAVGISPAMAQRRTTSSSAVTYSSSSSSSGAKHVLSPSLGFYGAGTNYLYGRSNNRDEGASMFLSGLFGIGLDYEYLLKPDFSIGGFVRYYSASDTFANNGASQEITNRATIVGATARFYLINTESFLGYFNTGVNTVSVTYKSVVNTTTTEVSPDMGFGFHGAAGILYKVSPLWSIGVENLRVMSLGEKINGWVVNDFMVKARFVL